MDKLLYFLLLISPYSFGQVQYLQPGKFKPGFTSVTLYDETRPPVREQPATDKGRIIQINTWYPSIGNTQKMSFGDYVKLIGLELDSTTVDPLQKGIDKYFEWPASLGADKNKFGVFLEQNLPMQACRDAKRLKKTYPLVLLVHGFGADHAYLAEYLAGNGYIVVQVPVKGTTSYELDYEGMGLESQVKDYEFALALLKNEFPLSKVAVAGFSFGGQSAVALALRNKEVKAIISLDGGIGSAFGAQLLSRQTYYDVNLVTVPLLHLYNPTDTYTDLSWLNSIKNTNRFFAAMKNMQHGHFTSFGLLNRIIPGIMGQEHADPGHAYESVMLLTKEFLNKSLKAEAGDHSRFFELQKTKYPWINDCIQQTEVKSRGS